MHDEQLSFFEQERLKYTEDIAKSFEQLLDSTNALNRNLEEFTTPSIRNELRSVADLWTAFKNLMYRPQNQSDTNDPQAQGPGQFGIPGTGGYIAGQK